VRSGWKAGNEAVSNFNEDKDGVQALGLYLSSLYGERITEDRIEINPRELVIIKCSHTMPMDAVEQMLTLLDAAPQRTVA